MVSASIVGDLITVYVNGVQLMQVTDDSFSSGSPGMGFYLQGASGMNGDFGFTQFTASQSSTESGSALTIRALSPSQRPAIRNSR